MAKATTTVDDDTASLLRRIEALERENKELHALTSSMPPPVGTSKTVAPVASEGSFAESPSPSSASPVSSLVSPSALIMPKELESPITYREKLSPLPREPKLEESIMLDFTEGCSCSFAGSQFYTGRVTATDLRLSFSPQQPTPHPSQHFIVDLALIDYVKVEKKPKLEEGKVNLGDFPVSIACKDGRNFVFRLRLQAEQKALLQVIDMMAFPPDYPKQLFACLNRETELKGYRFDLLKAWNRLMSHEILVPSELGVSQVTVGLQTFHVGCVYTGHKADSKVGVQLRCVPSYSESYFKPPRIIPDGRQCVILSLQKGQEGTWFAWAQPLSQEQDMILPPTKPPPKKDQGGYVPLEELQPYWDRSERCAREAHARGTTYYAGTAYEVARGDSKTRTKLRCCAALVKTKRSLFNPSRVVGDGAIVVAKLFRQSPADGVWFAWVVPLENARRNPNQKKKEKKNEAGFIRLDSLITTAASSAIAPDEKTLEKASSTDMAPDEEQAASAVTSATVKARCRFHSVFPNWMIVSNTDFKLVPTYPEYFVVPAFLKQYGLAEVIDFRSKGRLPVLIWLDPTSGAAMLRCSQPKMGAAGVKRCPSDERLYEVLKQRQDLANERTGLSTKKEKVLIVDCRPRVNALANRASGRGGYEKAKHYPNTELEYLKIGNIHVMRKSCNKLKELCAASDSGEDDLYWHRSVDSTDWLAHLRRILLGAGYVAHSMRYRGKTVIVHCSDGWDRTPQITSLTQLLLDPECRTLEGFCDLIEKDWLAFGHQFARRFGHGSADYKDDQRCPVFIQFIDCVWQLLNIFPTAFEFNEAALMCIIDASRSHRFGTFQCDNQKQRQEHNLFENSSSVWKYMMHPDRHHLFKQPAHMVPGTNPAAIPLKHMPLLTADHNSFRVMIVRQVTVWINYWMRYTAVPCTTENYIGLLHQATSPNPVRSDALESADNKTSED